MLHLVLLVPFIASCHAGTIVVPDYILNFNGTNCTIGQNLKVSYKKNFDNSYNLCDRPNQEQLNTICQTVTNCTGNTGLITSGGENGESAPLKLGTTNITFLEGCFAPVRVVCFDAQKQCTLPENVPNGHLSLSGKILDLSLQRVVNLSDTITLTCETGYTWYYSHISQCKQVKTAQLEWPLECIKNEQDRKMKMVASVTDKSNILKLTGNYTYCIELTLVSLFTQALATYNIPDLLEDVDSRPQKYTKRALTTTPSIRIDMLGILVDNQTTPIGIIIDFYVVFFKRVLTPDKLTKLFDSISEDQYNMTLQYRCAAACSDPNNCNAPAMGYYSKPKPYKPCLLNNKTLYYGEMINLPCGPGRFISEESTTYCLYGKYTSPSQYPTCGDCGQTLTNEDGIISAPKREENKHVRGANCTWTIKLKHNMIAWFNYPLGGVNCSQFIELREMHPDTNELIAHRRVKCGGHENRYGNLSSHLELTFKSTPLSDVSRAFEFEYHMIPPSKNWIEKYQTPILIAGVILVFLIGFVLLGMYCDHRKKNNKLRKADLNMRNVEVNDEISDSTMKPQATMVDKRKEFCDEAPLTPQPRKKKRRKKRKVSPGEVNDGVDAIEENSLTQADKMWTTRNGRELNNETDKSRTLERRSSKKDLERSSNKLHRPLPPVESEEEELPLPRQEEYKYNNAQPPETTFQPRYNNGDLQTSWRFQPFNGAVFPTHESEPETLQPITNSQHRDDAIRGHTSPKLHESNGGHSVTFKEDKSPPPPPPSLDKTKSVTKKKRRKKKVPDKEQLSPPPGVPLIERRPLPSIPPVHESIPGGDVD